ncbi:MAG: hypothetical protein VYD87_07265 [Pseudomonadota bacterium]|nr:hypothetical protein [Pseudomonadota bacterium]
MSRLTDQVAREALRAASQAGAGAAASAAATLGAPLAVAGCALAAAGLLTAAAVGFLAPALGWPGALLCLGLFWGGIGLAVAISKGWHVSRPMIPLEAADPRLAAALAAARTRAGRRGAPLSAAEIEAAAAAASAAPGHAAPPPPPPDPARPLGDVELAEMAIRAFRDAAVAGRALRGGRRRRR